MLLPATPGWVLLPVVVCGVWCVVCGVWCAAVVCWWGCGWCVVWLVPRHSWRRFLCAIPRHSWLGFAAGGGGRSLPLLAEGPGRGSLSLLAGVRWRRWCVVGLWVVCGVVGPSPLLVEVPVCYSPPLLAGFCCRWWCAAPRHSWLGPAGCGGVFRGWGCPLLCVFVVCVGVRSGCAVLCVACLWCLRCCWCGLVVRWVCLPRVLVCVVACVWCAGGLRFGAPAPCLSWPLAVGLVPRRRWLGSTGCGGGGPGCPSPWSWCVCVRCVALCVGVGGGGGSCAVWLPCVCVCVLAVCGWWGVSYLGWFSSSVVGMVQKAEEEVL